MIKEITLNETQKEQLEQKITDTLTVTYAHWTEYTITGLRLGSVQHEGDCYKAFYTYENYLNKIINGSMYFNCSITDNEITNFQECLF